MPALITVSDSDSELSCEGHVQPSLLAANDEVGFRKDWVHTVENEVTRGKLLRTEKPSTSRRKREYDAVNISLSRPYCNETHQRRKANCSQKHTRKTNSCHFQCNTSPILKPNTDISKKYNYRTKIKQKKCQMRLAELAIPTKRQCIDTWRNKSYLLPELMIERLKQYVMDQRPVVEISDAINCFRRRKSPSSKKSTKNKQCKCKTWNGPIHKAETRALCAIFGQKIAESLKTRLNLSLGSNYDKISRVVAIDIANIMYCRKNASKPINQTIHAEMSNKVTIWILNILEDASYKLLLEDIKDLEEEEGPVLDFIDDLITNVVTTSQPCTIHYESSSESSCKGEYHVGKEPCEINATLDTKSDIHRSHSSGLTDAEYFNNEINDLIFNFAEATKDEQGHENINKLNKNLNDNGTYEIEVIQEHNYLEEGDLIENINNNEVFQEHNDEDNSIEHRNNNEAIQDYHELELEGDPNENKNNNEAIQGHNDKDNPIEHQNNNEAIQDYHELELEGNPNENKNNNDAIQGHNDKDNSIEHRNVDESIQDYNELELEGDPIENTNNNETIQEHYNEDNYIEHRNNKDSELEGDPIEKTINNEAIQEQNDIEMVGNPSDQGINTRDDIADFDHHSLVHPEENHLGTVLKNLDGNINNDSNVSAVFEIFSEESLDDRNKKVTFSLIDMVNQDESTLLDLADTRQLNNENLNHEQEQESWKPNSNHKSDIVFSEPNLILLSDADELWPSDLSSLSLKASASVSKSIISLGNIIETDEKSITPYEDEDKVKVTKQTEGQVYQIIPVEDNIYKFEDSVSSLKELDEKNILIKKTDDLNLSIDVEIEFIGSPQTIIHTKQFEIKIHERSQGIEDKTYTEAKDFTDKYFEADFTSQLKAREDEYYKIENTPIIATEKLVNEEITLVTSDPVEDNTWTSTAIRDCDARDWCKHLEDGFKNLDLWTKWIDKIYQDIGAMKNRKELCARCSCVKRKPTTQWMKLIKNVNRDTILWRNVFLSSQEKNNNFRRIDHNNRIKVAPPACWYRCTCKLR